ncbi:MULTISPECIES: hypothetical protein [unclassified Algibacter]|uniref:TlpA family protein disulfide reductase n=1 Tax=unclassified Algibacter TaxID=2615009 RepID=UPI00131E2FEC|nr:MULTISPECIES: hypothetical protein [unclassified Algibacter]MCL5128335.1 hypothetical protein [Algibacter sp. L4_22]
MRILFSILSITLLISGCKNNAHDLSDGFAYIGGEIVNPIENTIILESRNKIIDTIKLDGRNRFIYKINNLHPGLYTFKHGSEYQMIILEPNDSLLFRLNTFDFDESLVYTGRGAKQNNFLLNEFLENKKTEQAVRRFKALDPEKFTAKLDSIKQAQLAKFKKFKKKNDVSKTFENLILEHINFSYYASKETYPFRSNRTEIEKIYKTLPKDFYAYRKDIDYNNSKLRDFVTYKWFLKSNISNLALNEHLAHCNKFDFKRGRSLCFNLDRLKQIDSLISDKSLKEELLYHYTVKFLSLSHDTKETNTILKNYLAKTENEKGKQMIINYAEAVSKLDKGNKLPPLDIVDYRNNSQELSDIVKGPTVITFWSNMYYDHFKTSHHKLKSLKAKYPEVTFISINIDNYNVNKARRLLQSNGFVSGNEYFFKSPKLASEALAIHPVTKTFIINKNKTISNGNTNIFYSKFEDQLLGLLKK